jgi:hypothetical protein
MKATKYQKQIIYRIASYNKAAKEEWVQWATNDNSKTSTNDLSFDQANAIIEQAGFTHITGKSEKNWAYFDNGNSRHRRILSLLRQLNWVINSEKHGKIADLNRLSNFLKSDKSPVNRPLQKMNSIEVSKTIAALEGIIKSNYK